MGAQKKRELTQRPRRVSANKGSGNVFADMGLPNPEQEILRAQLTLRIYQTITERGLTQADAGKILGIQQPHVSALMRNRSGVFSAERLMRFLTALDHDVEIVLKPKRHARGELRVVA